MVLLNTYGTHKAHFLVDPCVCVRALKVWQSRNDFFKLTFLPKNEQTNSTLLLWYLRSTCFCSYFGGNWRHQKDISKLIDLSWHTFCDNNWKHDFYQPSNHSALESWWLLMVPLAAIFFRHKRSKSGRVQCTWQSRVVQQCQCASRYYERNIPQNPIWQKICS